LLHQARDFLAAVELREQVAHHGRVGGNAREVHIAERALSLAPISGFTGTVGLSRSGAPPAAGCAAWTAWRTYSSPCRIGVGSVKIGCNAYRPSTAQSGSPRWVRGE